MKRNSVWCLSLGVVLSLGIVGAGCSSDDSPSVDAGKRDGSANKGGSTSAGGSTGTGGSSATGGTPGTGGSGAGGSGSGGGGSASGGSSGNGGSGAGGSSGTGGSTGGSASGGSTGTGGSGTGGTSSVDAGAVDATGADASDVSINNDGSIDSGSVDTGGVSLDAGVVDAAEIDTTIVSLDAGIDTSAVDLSGIDGSNPIPCSTVTVIAPGTQSTGYFGTKGGFCFATCDDIAGWGASNFEGRTVVLVNGQSIGVGSMPLPAKVQGKYTVFQVNGSDTAVTYASMYWWGTAATSCEAPAGGFGLN